MRSSFSRRGFVSLVLGATSALLQRPATSVASVAEDPLSSWNDGPAKRAILECIREVTNPASSSYVQPADRIATFDQDGTLWVEHPIYTQVVFALDRVVALEPQHPQWKSTPPFSAVLTGDKAAMAKFTTQDLEAIVVATHSGMDVEAFQAIAKAWIAKAKNPRWNRLYTELIYTPMLEVMSLLQSNGFANYIVTGGGQEFVRAYANRVYGLEPQRVIGSAVETQYRYNSLGDGILMRTPKLLLDNNMSGKVEDIYLFTGRRPQMAFGNSTGDRQMLEWTQAGKGVRLMMLVLHDDAAREYAYGPALGLAGTKVGTFTPALYDEAERKGWLVISMKRDWRRIFSFE
jgi:hypothetical protein